MWTEFYDMSSGGSKKTDWTIIYIELPIDQAVEYFENRFDINPYNETCSCCGQDFWVSEFYENPLPNDYTLIISADKLTNNEPQYKPIFQV